MDKAEQIRAQLLAFSPQDAGEAKAKEIALKDCDKLGAALLERSASCHFTSSALVCSPSLEKVLMIHHNLYHTYAWPGGHVDGSADFLGEALREIREETGVGTVTPISGGMLSLDILPVPEQVKNGQVVPAHDHYSVGYGCIVSEEEPLRVKPDENSDVRWFPVSELAARSGEPHMIAVYEKILRRMNALKEEKHQLYKALPGLLLPWYRANGRDLPWRRDREPYHVWLSEIMLQQTRVEAVKGYYQRFLETLPTVEALAGCDEGTLLKLWEGLGYYNRVRNLQKAAQVIVSQYNGQFPMNYDDILALPGIGAYTAGAVSSICFGAPTPAVDGNVLRVISRITEDFTSIDVPMMKREITASLAAVYPAVDCGDFTQSLMELGATVCVPNGPPRCGECPASSICLACRNSTQTLLPVKKKKAARRVEQKTVFVLQCGGHVAVEQRRERGVLHGLWQFPNVPGKLGDRELDAPLETWHIGPVTLERVTERRHIFTHIEWEMTCYYLQCSQMSPSFTWVTGEEMKAEIALPTAFKLFWDDLAE